MASKRIRRFAVRRQHQFPVPLAETCLGDEGVQMRIEDSRQRLLQARQVLFEGPLISNAGRLFRSRLRRERGSSLRIRVELNRVTQDTDPLYCASPQIADMVQAVS